MKPIDLYVSTLHAKSYIEKTKSCNYYIEINQDMSLPLRPRKYKKIEEENLILSFDYSCSSILWQLIVTISKKYNIFFRNVVATTKWRTISIDISAHLEALSDFIFISEDSLVLTLIPYPTSTTVKFKIRNIRLRAFSQKEGKRKCKRKAYSIRKALPQVSLRDYLYETEFPCEIKSVSENNDIITVLGNVCRNGREFHLYEIPVFGEFSTSDFNVIKLIEPESDGSFMASFPRKEVFSGKQYDRIFSRFAIGIETTNGLALASHARYADCVSSMYSIPKIIAKNKKGLGGFVLNDFESDLDELGISHVTVNIRINDFLSSRDNKDTIPFSYNGTTYHIIDKVIKEYDKILLAAAKRGIIVYAIILVYPENMSSDSAIGQMIEHPEYDTAGAYTMPDLTSLESTNLYAAALDFLASRYSRPDCLYGHIHKWIVHNEVDSAWIWCNAGKKSALEFASLYLKSIRMVYYSALKYNAEAQVYVPLTHYWNKAFDIATSYPGRQVLKILQDICKVEGDFPWGIAYHAYPEIIWEPKSWLDKHASMSEDTDIISFKNIEVLDRWAGKQGNNYNRKPRSVILSEQNPNSIDYSEKCLAEQAASLAYVLRKVNRCRHIEAYIAHSWIDDPDEGGLKTGLRKYLNYPGDPGGGKLSWQVMRDIGTDQESKVYDSIDKIINQTTEHDIS